MAVYGMLVKLFRFRTFIFMQEGLGMSELHLNCFIIN